MGAEPTVPTAEGPAVMSCDRCGHVIGVYEPMLIAEGGHLRQSSRAAEVSLRLMDTPYYHRACYFSL